MISKRQVSKLAKVVSNHIFKDNFYKPNALDIRFVKRRPAQVLRKGFVTLVPSVKYGDAEKVVLHIRDRDRLRSVDSMIMLLAHELLHAKQILNHDLSQDPKTGVITFLGLEYVHRYNVNFGFRVVTQRKKFESITPPWEYAVSIEQEYVTKEVVKLLEEREAP